MKHGYRHVQGKRICEAGGCMEAWPCERHGTRVAWSGSELPRPRYAPRIMGEIASFERKSHANAWAAYDVFGSPVDTKCASCGYAVCRHRPEEDLDQEVENLKEDFEAANARRGVPERS